MRKPAPPPPTVNIPPYGNIDRDSIFQELFEVKEGLSIGAFIGGILVGVIGGIGLGIALLIFFIGVAYKLLTANIW